MNSERNQSIDTSMASTATSSTAVATCTTAQFETSREVLLLDCVQIDETQELCPAWCKLTPTVQPTRNDKILD